MVAQAKQFTPDPLEAPAGVIGGHPLDQLCERDVDGRAAGTARVRPAARDQPPMPVQHRGRGDQPVRPQRPWQQPDQGGEHGAIGPIQPRLRVPATQDGVLVPQDQDLHILGRARRSEQHQPPEHTTEHEVQQPQP
jgi:hypothetical protein